MKFWVVKHKDTVTRWINLSHSEIHANNGVLGYAVHAFPKRKWAREYCDSINWNAQFEVMEVVAVEVNER